LKKVNNITEHDVVAVTTPTCIQQTPRSRLIMITTIFLSDSGRMAS